LVIHGAIHVAGFAKAYGLAELPQLATPIARPAGLIWLAAGIGLLATAALMIAGVRLWAVLGVVAVFVSQALIISDFRDARFGTVVNAALLVIMALSLAELRPSSLTSRYRDDAGRLRSAAAAVAPSAVTEADLDRLPPLVQTYLRRAGVVGRPHVHSFHALFKGRIRRSPAAPWMALSAEQRNFLQPAPARLFFLDARQWGLPFVGYHRYEGSEATMQIRVAGVLEVVDARGPVMTRSETVTMLNDMCVLAPAMLVDAPVTWKAAGDHQVEATYSNAGHTVSAVLTFDAGGDLVGFVSGDRYQSDGKLEKRLPWSTPLADYRDFGPARLAARGEARWREPAGEWAYGEFALRRITYNE
jgi:hypothetical protein